MLTCASLRLLSFLSLCIEAIAADVTAFQTTSTSSRFLPLTTGFTPAAECSSLTILHSQRLAAVYQGCIGSDTSCCPQSGRLTNTYSPGKCPLGYVTEDAHVGLDDLATDTLEWEATCVPTGFSTCRVPIWRQPHQIPIGRDNMCPQPYTSKLPDLTTPFTAVVIYYSTYDPALGDSTLPWPYREGFRSTTVLSETWPILTPADTAPTQIIASPFIIRWKDSDFSSTPVVPISPGSTLTDPHSESTATMPITTLFSSGSSVESQISTPTRSISSCVTCQTTTTAAPSSQLSHQKIAGLTVGVVLGTASLVFGALVCWFRRRKRLFNREIDHELYDPGPNIGCLTLYKGDTDLVADIVLIHGLRGHRTRTWTKDGCCWPKDLLPRSLPGVRVITFGYDSSVARIGGRSSNNNISHHATSLLSDLLHMRINDPERPIIFVTHSLGGILIKDALHKARQPNPSHRYLPIFTSTHSIVFLGTPHHGSTYARLGRSLASTVRSLLPFLFHSSNPSLLHSIEIDSQILERIGEDFRNTLACSESQGRVIKVASFAEELGLGLGSLASPIVQTRSAFIGLPDEITETIWAHHRDICRFGDELDIGYQRVSRRIIEFVADASAGPSSRSGRSERPITPISSENHIEGESEVARVVEEVVEEVSEEI